MTPTVGRLCGLVWRETEERRPRGSALRRDRDLMAHRLEAELGQGGGKALGLRRLAQKGHEVLERDQHDHLGRARADRLGLAIAHPAAYAAEIVTGPTDGERLALRGGQERGRVADRVGIRRRRDFQ